MNTIIELEIVGAAEYLRDGDYAVNEEHAKSNGQ